MRSCNRLAASPGAAVLRREAALGAAVMIVLS
jgi:hypothetical protein